MSNIFDEIDAKLTAEKKVNNLAFCFAMFVVSTTTLAFGLGWAFHSFSLGIACGSGVGVVWSAICWAILVHKYKANPNDP